MSVNTKIVALNLPAKTEVPQLQTATMMASLKFHEGKAQ